MLYMSSSATMDGGLAITITFRIGADVDRAQVQVQNRVSQALPRLPEEVRNLGVTTVKSSPNLTMVVNLTSPDGRYDALYLRNYAVLNVRDVLARLPGMGQVQVFGGGDYAFPSGWTRRNLPSAISRQVMSSPPSATRTSTWPRASSAPRRPKVPSSRSP